MEPNSLKNNVTVSSDNVTTVSNDNGSAEQCKLRSHNGNNQQSEMITNSSSGNTGNSVSGNTSIETCSGTSKIQAISVNVVGKELVANSPVSSSEPPGPSSSGVRQAFPDAPFFWALSETIWLGFSSLFLWHSQWLSPLLLEISTGLGM